jgi:hypothetical protein
MDALRHLDVSTSWTVTSQIVADDLKVNEHTSHNEVASSAFLPEYPSDAGVKVISNGPLFILNSIPTTHRWMFSVP